VFKASKVAPITSLPVSTTSTALILSGLAASFYFSTSSAFFLLKSLNLESALEVQSKDLSSAPGFVTS